MPTSATGLVGVLALQGGFAAHEATLRSLGATIKRVRVPADMKQVAALVLPGGESTTMMLGIEREGLSGPINDFVAAGNPVLATCAGTILLSESHLRLIDVACERNAYGGQIHSFEAPVELDAIEGNPFRGVFIRAPRITRAGDAVEIIGTHEGAPVAVRQGAVIALTFHPELSGDDRMHRLFLESIPAGTASELNTKRRAA